MCLSLHLLFALSATRPAFQPVAEMIFFVADFISATSENFSATSDFISGIPDFLSATSDFISGIPDFISELAENLSATADISSAISDFFSANCENRFLYGRNLSGLNLVGIFDNADKRQISVTIRRIQAVADDEFVGDLKAAIVDL